MQNSKNGAQSTPEQSLKIIQDHQAAMKLRAHDFDQDALMKIIADYFGSVSASETEAHLLRMLVIASKDKQFFGDGADLQEKIALTDAIIHLIHITQKFMLTATVPRS